MKRILFFILGMMALLHVDAQSDSVEVRQRAVPVDDGWFLQFGADWTLTKPYGHPFSEMIQNGSSVGLDTDSYHNLPLPTHLTLSP